MPRPPLPPEPEEGGQPEIYSVRKKNDGIVLSRRSFLGAAAAAGALAICAPGAIRGEGSPGAPPPAANCGDMPAHKSHVQGLFTLDDALFSWDGGEAKAWSWTKGALLKSLRRGGRGFEITENPAPFPVLFSRLDVLTGRHVFAPDGKLLALVSRTEAWIWSSKDGEPKNILTLDNSRGDMTSACFFAAGKSFAVGRRRGAIELYSLGESEPRQIMQAEEGHHPSSLAVSSGEDFLLCGASEGFIWLFSLPDGKVIMTAKTGDSSPVSEIAVLPGGALAAAVANGKVLFLNLPACDPAGELSVPGESVYHVSVSSGGQRLAAGTFEGGIYLFDSIHSGAPPCHL
jgi:WD40 repeat protein